MTRSEAGDDRATQRFTPYLFYEDVEGALAFLAEAFGFTEVLRYSGPEGYVRHAEMRLGDQAIMLGCPGGQYRNPSHADAVSAAVYVTVDDVQALFECAGVAGAEIIEPLTQQPYGGARFGARDPEGHQWWFSGPSRSLAATEWSTSRPMRTGDDPLGPAEEPSDLDAR
jgi:PhnB protein